MTTRSSSKVIANIAIIMALAAALFAIGILLGHSYGVTIQNSPALPIAATPALSAIGERGSTAILRFRPIADVR